MLELCRLQVEAGFYNNDAIEHLAIAEGVEDWLYFGSYIHVGVTTPSRCIIEAEDTSLIERTEDDAQEECER
jgi:hypothetical protein